MARATPASGKRPGQSVFGPTSTLRPHANPKEGVMPDLGRAAENAPLGVLEALFQRFARQRRQQRIQAVNIRLALFASVKAPCCFTPMVLYSCRATENTGQRATESVRIE